MNDPINPTKFKQNLKKIYSQHKGKDKRFIERNILKAHYN